MKGLRTQENAKFNKFFELVQNEARSKNAVFFADSGEGDIFENAAFECETLLGWLIPQDKVAKFEPLFMENSTEQHNFDDFYSTVEFKEENGKIKITINTEAR